MNKPNQIFNTSVLKLSLSDWEIYKSLRLKSLKDEPQVYSTSSYEEEVKFSDDHWLNNLKKSELEKELILLFAKIGGEVVGLLGCRFDQNSRFDHIATICSFYILPEFRNKGIGSRLMEEMLLKIAARKDILKARLMVNSEQVGAIGLYKKYGFETIAILKDEFKINGRFFDKLMMEKRIKPNLSVDVILNKVKDLKTLRMSQH